MTRVVVLTLILCCISKDTICKRSYSRITSKRFDKKLNYFFNGQPQSTAFVTGPRTRPRIQDKSFSRIEPHQEEFRIGLRDMRYMAHRKRTKKRPSLPKRQDVTKTLKINIERSFRPFSKYWQAKSLSQRPRSWQRSRAQIRTSSRHKTQEAQNNERTLQKWGNITSPVNSKETKGHCDAIDTRLRTEKYRISPKLRHPHRKHGYVLLSAGPKYHVNLDVERQANNLDKGLSDNIQRSEAHSVIQFPSPRSRFLSIISSLGVIGVFGYLLGWEIGMKNQIRMLEKDLAELETTIGDVAAVNTVCDSLCSSLTCITEAQACLNDGSSCQDTVPQACTSSTCAPGTSLDSNIYFRNILTKIAMCSDPTCLETVTTTAATGK